MRPIQMQTIGVYHCDFSSKFGIPRQSALASELSGCIAFEPPFCDPNYLRGIEAYSHLWLLWQFSEAKESAAATVRPPKLGGNTRIGVFASRSPFRPNRIGLSCVMFDRVEQKDGKLFLFVRGGDLMDGTPILDIKPYLPYADCVPNALGGFGSPPEKTALAVSFPAKLQEKIPAEKLPALLEALRQDPRPGYHEDEQREYGMPYAGFEIMFRVAKGELTVTDVKTKRIKRG